MDRAQLVGELRRYGLGNGSTLGRHIGIMDEAADAIEELSKDVEYLKGSLRLRAELEWLKKFAQESCFDNEVCRDQFRCLWTAFALHYNYDVDTRDYDTTILELWEATAETEPETADWSDYDSFYNYMAKYLC